MDEENRSQDESESDDVSNIYGEDNDFQPHNNYASDGEDGKEEDGVVENWEWEPLSVYLTGLYVTK